MHRYAVVDKDNCVVNIILWDHEKNPDYGRAVEGTLVRLKDGESVEIGYMYDVEKHVFTKPVEVLPELHIVKAQAVSAVQSAFMKVQLSVFADASARENARQATLVGIKAINEANTHEDVKSRVDSTVNELKGHVGE